MLTLVVLLGAGCGTAEPDEPDASSQPTAPSPTGSPSTSAAAPTSPSPSREATARGAAPQAVAIPSLGLDEELVDLGLTADGVLEVPSDPDRVGWFTGGGRPGGTGPTVVVGHVDSTTGPAVFARLPELGEGDVVRVTDRRGRRTTYAVTGVEDVPQVPFPTEQVFGATPEDTLRLITCTGPYDAAAGRYTENRIVTAVPRT